MRRRRAMATLLGLLAGGAVRAQSGPKIRALIVDGFSNHDWRKTTAFLRDTLSATGLFEVEVSTSPDEPDSPAWASWRPDFRAYDLVLQNSNNIQRPELRWPREVELALESYVRSGGGLLIHHSANNAFPHWAEYDRMIGLGWRDKDAGVALRLDPEGRITRIPPGQGENTSHGPRQDTVVIRRGEHPIHSGYPPRWLTPDIEVYTYARGPVEELTVLSYGRHHAADTWWPLEWTVGYGQGRVYNSSFGHIWKTDEGIPDRVRCVGFQTTLIRAAQWVAAGRVSFPVPADFPGEHAIRLR